MPLDNKRPGESQKSTNESIKRKKLTQLFCLSDTEDEDVEDQPEEQEPDFDVQPTLVLPKTQSSGWDAIPLSGSSGATIGTTQFGRSQSERGTGNTEFSIIPATQTQSSMATVSSGVCPDSVVQITDPATLLLLSYFTDGGSVKRDHTQVDTGTGQVQAKKPRTEAQPGEVEQSQVDPTLIKPLGFSFAPLMVPPEGRRRPVSILFNGQQGVPNFKRFKKVMPDFTTGPSAPIGFIVHSEFGGMWQGRGSGRIPVARGRRPNMPSPPTPGLFFGLETVMRGDTYDPAFPERDEFSFDGE